MKKEKQIKAYTRRTKSGKMVTVKVHTAKYDAADMAKEALKKKGAGDEFEQRYRSQLEKKPAGAGSTGRIKKETDQDKAAKLKEVVAKLKKQRHLTPLKLSLLQRQIVLPRSNLLVAVLPDV